MYPPTGLLQGVHIRATWAALGLYKKFEVRGRDQWAIAEAVLNPTHVLGAAFLALFGAIDNESVLGPGSLLSRERGE